MRKRRVFTFLGTGTSVGVPMVGCACPTCTSGDPRDQRWRCAAAIATERGNLLIDTPPELRLQLLRAKIPLVHAVLLTHYHADHLFGMDDLRVFPHQLGGPLPLYCTEETQEAVRRCFAYAFEERPAMAAYSFVPRLRLETIAPGEPFEALGELVTPIHLEHSVFNVMGFRIGSMAYCTDVNRIPPASLPFLHGLDVLVLDALRFKRHPAHFNLEEALEVVKELRPKQTWLTHMSHDVEHAPTEERLPPGVNLAYDGLSFEF